jgi:twitching motility two-component system response regulator PilG
LKEGIAAAKAGDKGRARLLLRASTALDAHSEAAWMWLAGVAESPLEAIPFLERVLVLAPGHERAGAALKGARLQAGIAAAKAQDRVRARDLLRAAIQQDPASEMGWLWLASVAESNAEAVSSLEKVLAINPGNTHARTVLARYRSRPVAVPEPALPLAPARATAPAPRPAAEPEPEAEEEPAAWQCPLCLHEDEQERQRCPGCGALLSLQDPEAFAQLKSVDVEEVQAAIGRLGQGDTEGDFTTCYHLGLAYLNLKQTDDALGPLQAALRLRPGDADLRAAVAALLRTRAANEGPQREAARGLRKTILVVDDSPTIRKLVALTVERRGFQARAAADAYEAIDVIRNRGIPDLILLDISMPGMDGYQLCKLLRQNADTARLPIVMLSGKDGFFSKVRGRLAGSTAYVTKPFEPEGLLRVVEQYCLPEAAPVPEAARNGRR